MHYYNSIFQIIIEYLGHPIILLYFSEREYCVFNFWYQAKDYLLLHQWNNLTPLLQELYWNRLRKDKKVNGIQILSYILPINSKYFYFSIKNTHCNSETEIYPNFHQAWKTFRNQAGFFSSNYSSLQQVKLQIISNKLDSLPHYLYSHSNDNYTFSLFCVKLNQVFI